MKTVLTTLLAICVCLVIGCGQGGEAKEFEKQLAAAERGDADAQYWLGEKYHMGQGVEQDFKEAVKWWHKAAEQGVKEAQFCLGAMYYRGDGVPEDIVTAFAWFNIAAANGCEAGKEAKDTTVNKRLEKITPTQISKAQALSKEMIAKNPKLMN